MKSIQVTLTEPQMKSLFKFLHRTQLSGGEVGEFVQLTAVLGTAADRARETEEPRPVTDPA